jgi:ParB-like chromosome segregation protein Spo0J
MIEGIEAEGADVPLSNLVPLQERNINLRTNIGFKKIVSTIQAVGLLEPLCVYRDNGKYSILDGYLRYRACQQLGIETVPCLVYDQKEAYTYGRMVNPLSPGQEIRMLRTSLKTVDEKTVAGVFGLTSLKHRLAREVVKHLAPEVIRALDDDKITRGTAKELTHVLPDRQVQILKELAKNNDYSLSFVRALVVRTPEELRNPKKRALRAWTRDSAKKKELVKKLEVVEKRHDFYQRLYRQYSHDLVKLSIHARALITNDAVRAYLAEKHPEILAAFEKIVFSEPA